MASLYLRITLLLCFCLCVATACSRTLPNIKNGDIIFQTSNSSQSVAVQRATHSRYSHMGIIFVRHGHPYVFEASATVRATPLAKWIAHGVGGKAVIKRLRKELTKTQVKRLKATARTFAGKRYDLTFEWSDTRMYCSELVWKIYHRALGIRIGKRQHLRDFDLSDPAVRAKIKERYGDRVPMSEVVISPASMFNSPKLRVVSTIQR